MNLTRAALCAATALTISTPVLAAKPMSDKERLRQEAEHVCYNDATTLCGDSVPDEDKIAACMTVKRAQLSPECGKVFDRGMKM